MKLFVFCVLAATVAVHALTDQQKQKLNAYINECKAQTGVSQELIDRGRKGEFVDDPTVKSQILCMMKKIGMATESGEVVVDDIRNKLRKVSENDEEVGRIIQKCVVKLDTPEETAFEVSKCIRQQKPNFSPVD
ncbi:PBP GOBP domain containing protein [Asbolus verrucosus]|uniref:PBP GOBP domain containing protein n=1 Tax=Asbolus verrucosus TaxID=1661398 RepID=A0A482WD59_ASBVE|nr:PBP GOBP domain containing protein [Asbolus verrucosus]